MTAAIVQSANGGWWQNSGGSMSLGSAVTAGNLLVLAEVGTNYFGYNTLRLDPFVTGDASKVRTFTAWRQVDWFTGAYGTGKLTLAYRIATGDEQNLTFSGRPHKFHVRVIEVSGAGDPTTFVNVYQSLHAASATKTIGTLGTPGDLQFMVYGIREGSSSETVAAGWTEDYEGRPSTGTYNKLVGHASTGPAAEISGTSAVWGGLAVGIVGGTVPQAAFDADPRSGVAPLAVDFTDLSTGVITDWDWDYGDGSTHGTTQNPSHTYTVPGVYDVTLSVNSGASSFTQPEFVTVAATPAAGVVIDWNGDGFDVGAYDDVSANVISWVISRGSGPELTGGAQPGSCTLTLKNPNDIYNPYNASSPLYGLLRDGVAVWIGPNADGALTGTNPRGLFGGRITDISPIPAGGADDSPTVEIICEDFLGWAPRLPVSLDFTEGLAQDALRRVLLSAVDESRYDLDHEIQTINVPQVTGDLGPILGGINAATGTRHFVKPADNFTDWYAYTTRNRFWRTDATSDSSVDASSDHVTGTTGWRLAADTVTNQQKVTFSPVVFTPGTFTVWKTQRQKIEVTASRPFRKTVQFDDIVRDAVLDVASTGATLISTLDAVSDSARITLTVISGTAVVTHLSIEGRLARRPHAESYTADDLTSQAAPRGIRAGSEISNEFVGSFPSAVGLADHVVWRFGNPQLRPGMTVKNWLPDQFDLDLYDVIAVTSPQLKMTAHLFEIVGLTHTGEYAASASAHLHTVDYVLQECRSQTDPNWFTLNTSTLAAAGTDVLHY